MLVIEVEMIIFPEQQLLLGRYLDMQSNVVITVAQSYVFPEYTLGSSSELTYIVAGELDQHGAVLEEPNPYDPIYVRMVVFRYMVDSSAPKNA